MRAFLAYTILMASAMSSNINALSNHSVCSQFCGRVPIFVVNGILVVSLRGFYVIIPISHFAAAIPPICTTWLAGLAYLCLFSSLFSMRMAVQSLWPKWRMSTAAFLRATGTTNSSSTNSCANILSLESSSSRPTGPARAI